MKKHINYKIENKDSYENGYLNNEINMEESDIMKTRSSEIKNANKERFQNGTSKLAKRRCYGYSQNDKGELIINPEETLTVMWIFESYLSGYSLGKIANELFERGVKSPSGKDRWNREAIDKLLSNEKYVGSVLLRKTVTVNGTQIDNKGLVDRYLTANTHPAIINLELFKAVQNAKVERSRGNNMGINTAHDMLNIVSGL